MKIGILGGSFDPIHNGHIHMALAACDKFALDQLWLIPAGHSPNKDEKSMTDAIHRYHMCELAAKADHRLRVSRVEIDSEERSYTYRTLQKITEEMDALGRMQDSYIIKKLTVPFLTENCSGEERERHLLIINK